MFNFEFSLGNANRHKSIYGTSILQDRQYVTTAKYSLMLCDLYVKYFLSIFPTLYGQIGQLVFKGLKRLNRIQSMVFETAYNTNENLLICAPTGAGKTNIAMLTVLHEIRQHLQPGGIIKKDEFKVWCSHTLKCKYYLDFYRLR